ncbi:MAG: alpha-glucosidase C-terminal domain-containing protein [Chloroflexi bacterium]|nr:alpha-glucosidase C-terminal domain-containing protein [Chloroflexota bacterium]
MGPNLSGPWWQTGVIYQIYPRSFQDTNGDGVGDLAGITTRLDYLNDGTPGSLGVDAIWLSPFYPSPMADFGYDVADYLGVDPLFGTLADFDALVHAAHARGIRVVVDLVPNHTSDRHPWFVESRSSRDNPKRHWYVWADPKADGSPPNNWLSEFRRVGRAWTLDAATGQYYLHSFLPQQPDLNWWDPEVREAMDGVLRFWLDRGVDGFRIDVAHRMAHDPELRDNPLIEAGEDGPRGDEDWPEVHAILRRFRQTLEAYGDRMMMGETYLPDPARMVRYYGEAVDELHLAQNFVFLQQPWRAAAMRAAVDQFESLLPAGAWPDYFLNNHDHSRVVSRYDEGGNGLARARMAAIMLLTLRGTPLLYQGEELGLADVPIPPERAYDIAGRDPERTPMPWDRSATPGAGFTTGEPWLPLGAHAARVNMAAQHDDPASMLSLYRRLIWYRKSSAALLLGSYRPLDSAPDGVFAYLREADSERLLVALNFTNRPIEVDAGGVAASGHLELSTDSDRLTWEVGPSPLPLGPNEGVIVRLS